MNNGKSRVIEGSTSRGKTTRRRLEALNELAATALADPVARGAFISELSEWMQGSPPEMTVSEFVRARCLEAGLPEEAARF